MKRIFLTGTDTEIGKTLVSSLLIKAFHDKGIDIGYFKPFQTGCKDEFDVDSDAKFVAKLNSFMENKEIRSYIGEIFKAPKAPWFAAENECKSVNIAAVEQNIPINDVVLLEGAGGLFVPLTNTILTIDWIKKLNAPVLLVARAGLGTINHTLLSLEALCRRSIPVLGVILSNRNNATEDRMIKENIQAIETFGKTKVLGVVSHVEDPSNLDEAEEKIFKDIVDEYVRFNF